jgi:nitrile hydratase beta subunit
VNGIHDMGGMHGFGPIIREADHEPVFHEAWEGRVYGMLSRARAIMPPRYPGDNRGYIEAIPPQTYLGMSYYERFMEALVQRAISAGVLTAKELQERIDAFATDASLAVPRAEDSEAVEQVRERLTTQLRPEVEGRAPCFKAGDAVMAINVSRVGHNRLPRYIRGKRGWVERVNGLYPIEDEQEYARDQVPQTVYTIGFEGTEVWGPESEPHLKVYLELWEGYLEPA